MDGAMYTGSAQSQVLALNFTEGNTGTNLLTVNPMSAISPGTYQDQNQYDELGDLALSGSSDGGVVARHTGMANVLWTDGHVKATGLNALARTAVTSSGKTVGAEFVGNGY
jgi:prepilin-type processing-associated H-X9-DG protein